MHSLTILDWPAKHSWPLPMIIRAATSSYLFRHNIFSSHAKSLIGSQGEVHVCECGRHGLYFAFGWEQGNNLDLPSDLG